jgi:hypothetical protein
LIQQSVAQFANQDAITKVNNIIKTALTVGDRLAAAAIKAQGTCFDAKICVDDDDD